MLGFIGDQCHFDTQIIYDICSLTKWVELPKLSKLNAAVSSHADMMCCQAGDYLIIEPSLYNFVVKKYPDLQNILIKGQTILQERYPNNIAYNVAFVGDFAIHNTHYTDPVLKAHIDKLGFKWIHTKQGYTNCMCLVVNERSVITSDKGLANVLEPHGINVLVIQQDYIDLPGLNFGFIGGHHLK